MPRKPQEFSKSFETFSHEVKDYWASRDASLSTWIAFILVNTANLIIIVTSATPAWGRTQEVVGQGAGINLEGEMIGRYSVWYNCFDSVYGYGRTCVLWTDQDFFPEWWPAFQAMMTLTFIFGFFTFLVLMFYMFARTLNRNLKVLATFVVLDCFALIFCVAGFTVFCILFLKDTYWCCHPELHREVIHYTLDWGFVLTCVAAGLYMFAIVMGIFEYMDIMRERRIEREFEEWRKRESMREFAPGHEHQPAASMAYSNMWR